MKWLRPGCVFVGATGFYLLLAGSLSWTEVVAGIGVGAAVTAVAMRQAAGGRALAPDWPPVGVLGKALWSLVGDSWRVGLVLTRALLGRGVDGTAEWQGFRAGGQNARDAGRRGLVTVLASVAPNGMVIDLRPSALPEAEHGLLLHRLAPAKALSGREWPV